MQDHLLSSLAIVADPFYLLMLATGVLLGISIGILPGLGGSAGLAILLPFVYGMDPASALAMMVGLLAVTTTSDTFPAVLMGIPGTSGSQATVLDGFPMAKRGEATRAISAGLTSSIFGGLVGAAILSVALIYAEPLLRMIGFPERLMLILFALSMLGMLTGTSYLKGLASCGLGLMLGSFGAAPITGVERLDFGTEYLVDRLPIVIIGLSLFAIPEIISAARSQSTISETGKLSIGWLMGIRDWAQNLWLSLRCAIIGALGGALPGIGGAVIDWIAYGHAIQSTKNSERYGTGDIRGVIAPESANNAKEGGALIPTLIFGIPGSGNMAILLGGFVLIGIQPGLSMLEDSGEVVFSVVWSLAIANILGAGLCLLLANQIAKITTVRYMLIAPFMIGLIFFASFQATRNWGDFYALLVLGTLGVYLKRFGWSRPALLIGFVLAPQLESNFYRISKLYGFELLSRPVVIALMVLTAVSVISIARNRSNETEADMIARRYLDTRPQVSFHLLITAFAIYLMVDGFSYGFLTGAFQIVAASVSLAFLLPMGWFLLTRNATSCHYDEEAAYVHVQHSGEYYVLIFASILAFTGILGFLVGAGSFIACLLVWKANVKIIRATIGGCLFSLLLFLLSRQLNLEYPDGLLNYFWEFWP
jgi:putative tricarboxylic transport membrane protein